MKENIVKLLIDVEGFQIEVTGWTRLTITRGIERIPNSFELQMTENIPDVLYVAAQPGSKCQVFIDDDIVVTGYVDRFIPTISGTQHLIQVTGRGMCGDLVDCSAVWQGMQFQNVTALQIAENLCAPFGITALSMIEEIPQIVVQNLNLGETPAAVLDRICKVSQLLYYENARGELLLNRESEDKTNGVLAEGINIESANLVWSCDQLYSEYTVVYPSAPLSMDYAGNQFNKEANVGFYTVEDQTAPRYRPLYIIPEEGDAGFLVAKQRAVWEKNRRLARSQMVRITTSIWRDLDENLWRPNTQVTIDIPHMGLNQQTWLIGEVTYRRDDMGTHCDLMVMPIGAFTPQPIVALPAMQDVIAAYLASQGKEGTFQ